MLKSFIIGTTSIVCLFSISAIAEAGERYKDRRLNNSLDFIKTNVNSSRSNTATTLLNRNKINLGCVKQESLVGSNYLGSGDFKLTSKDTREICNLILSHYIDYNKVAEKDFQAKVNDDRIDDVALSARVVNKIEVMYVKETPEFEKELHVTVNETHKHYRYIRYNKSLIEMQKARRTNGLKFVFGYKNKGWAIVESPKSRY